ncbi:MAG TPA: hypothetical protein VHT05_03590 [Candidatus Elarobacter sp.]|jgi:hypothetical protein|nr:hypothetical protein [Candidatus Elarobacter sp.]
MIARFVPLWAAALLVCAVPVAAAPSPAPRPPAPRVPAAAPFALVPSRPGTSNLYGYQLDENGPRGSRYVHGAVAITRLVNDRVLVAIAPESGAAFASVLAVGADGTLRAVPATPSDGVNRVAPEMIPPGLRALSALLASPPAGASWTVAVDAGDAAVPATLNLTARVAEQSGQRTVSADGNGTITVAQAAQSAQRGGYNRGGGRGGFGGGGFPGGGGMGGGRRGGASGGDENAGAPQRVPANVVLHVEASFRGSAFLGARGTEQTTPTQGDKTPSSATWSLFPY